MTRIALFIYDTCRPERVTFACLSLVLFVFLYGVQIAPGFWR